MKMRRDRLTTVDVVNRSGLPTSLAGSSAGTYGTGQRLDIINCSMFTRFLTLHSYFSCDMMYQWYFRNGD